MQITQKRRSSFVLSEISIQKDWESQSKMADSNEERTAAAFSIVKELKKMHEKCDKNGFSFLSYLLQMAILEAQAVASGESTDTNTDPDKEPTRAKDTN